ncbi:hypothetical protein [Methylobacterium aerolatum]|uniref:Uncharacterized protein n=1 Tax=Methylobacterium aerolatum TaxID=418708 RepID=A0ABU0I5E1_9HYPH|nr:hypothetical protein [Methylobacterium aerolatum]MDQ0449820.1 hypothetical protein [Methylobacterium aerolatum]GJD36590.1 hypothetical protein FMGBMHLM_3513 [Methylobacterium aerolatum]
MSKPPEICILGVDCGLTGALAWYFPSAPDRVAVEDAPTAGGEIDTGLLRRRIAQMGPTLAIVEQVHAMPKNGSIASFKLGMAYGQTRAAIEAAGIPTHLVSAQLWKRHFRLPGKTAGGEEAARALAIRLFPVSGERFERRKDHNRADAALLARYGADTIAKGEAA